MEINIGKLEHQCIKASIDNIKNLFNQFKTSKILSLQDNDNIRNLTDNLKSIYKITKAGNSNFDNKNLFEIQNIKYEINKFQNEIKKMKLNQLENFKTQVEQFEKSIKENIFYGKLNDSLTLQILVKIQDINVLDYEGYIVHCTPIPWKMWDKHFKIMQCVEKNIEWSKYTDYQILLCLFLWGAYLYPNDYNINLDNEDLLSTKHPTLLKDSIEDYVIDNKNYPENLNMIKESKFKKEWEKAIEIQNNRLGGKFDNYYNFSYETERIEIGSKFKTVIKHFKARIPNFRGGHFGKYEFFITLDGIIKNNLEIPYDLIKKFTPGLIEAIKYCEDNKIALVRYVPDTMECHGLKPDDFNDFVKINSLLNKKNKSKDWIEYYEKYVKDFKNKKQKI